MICCATATPISPSPRSRPSDGTRFSTGWPGGTACVRASRSGSRRWWRAILSPLPDAALTALGTLVPALGSLVLALALVEDQIGPEQAVALSRLEESRQAARWGSDPVIEAKEASVLHEVRQAYRFLVLSRD
jgi:hypothetical protein